MSLPQPKLDDRTFTDLAAEMRGLIPRYAPQWTDHNLTDPGITLIELWAWLAEMILYRLNIVTERTLTNFLKLILDRPAPVMLEITLMIAPPQDLNVIIPKGVKFATSPDATGKRIIFETFEQHIIKEHLVPVVPESLSEQHYKVTFITRNYAIIENEVLGISDGSPNQVFTFAHIPVLIDNFNTSRDPNAYNPNPKITVGGEEWFYVQDFLKEKNEVLPPKSFTVEKATHRLRFSDGKSAVAIPPKGAEIVCPRYQIVLGEEVKIRKDQNLELVNNTGFPGAIVIQAITHAATEGGLYILPFERARKQGLQQFQEQFRAVSAEDFLFLTTTAFNAHQQSPDPKIARAKVVPRRNLNLMATEEKKGEISIIVIPNTENDVAPKPSSELLDKVWKFLDPRRLVGTRHHVVGPRYIPVQIKTIVYRKPHAGETLQKTLVNALKKFLHPLAGGFDGKGWPFGRSLYPSEFYQLLENIAGVDYVESLELNGRSESVELKADELPTIAEADITVSIR